jgi:hypothetical protein
VPHLLRGHPGHPLGLGLRGVRRRLGRLLDALLGALFAALHLTRDLAAHLGGLAGFFEVDRLLEVLGGLRLDRPPHRGHERRPVERAGLLAAHLLDLGRRGLAGDVVARRLGGGLRGRGPRRRPLVALG